jgi:tetratricopeptide (TPR) repeat protein
MVNLGRVAGVHGDFEEARRLILRSIAVNEETRNRWGMSFCFAHLGRIYHAMNYYEEARAQYRAALAICEEINNRWVMSFTLIQVGRTEYRLNNFSVARLSFRRALTLASEIKAVPLMLDAMINLAIEFAANKKYILAMETTAFVLKHPVTEYETRVEARTLLKRLERASVEISPEVLASARARGEAADLTELANRTVESAD